jgi:excisionase family DNA binding protein
VRAAESAKPIETPIGAAKLLLTIPEVADELRIDKRTVYRLMRSGELPLQIIHIGQSPRVRRADLEGYLERLVTDAQDGGALRVAAAQLWKRRRRGA